MIFAKNCAKQGVEKPIEVEYSEAGTLGQVQKIKTDKGIEIIIPDGLYEFP